jgi:hypothetical protein
MPCRTLRLLTTLRFFSSTSKLANGRSAILGRTDSTSAPDVQIPGFLTVHTTRGWLTSLFPNVAGRSELSARTDARRAQKLSQCAVTAIWSLFDDRARTFQAVTPHSGRHHDLSLNAPPKAVVPTGPQAATRAAPLLLRPWCLEHFPVGWAHPIGEYSIF